MNSPVVGIQLDKKYSSKKTPGKYPVKLRITFEQQPRYYDTKVKLTPDDFDKITSQVNVRGDLRDEKFKLSAIQNRAIEIIEELDEDFDWQPFKERLQGKSAVSDVYGLFQEYIDKLKEEDRIGSAKSYQDALNSFKGFHPSKLKFKTITTDWLTKYEKYMTDSHKSLTTIGMYSRSLRTIYNLAIDKGIVEQKLYPFGKRRYQIPAPRNIKKAFSREQLKKLFTYRPEKDKDSNYEAKLKALDYWWFSYYCNGANPADIFRLKHSDVTEDSITFIREKTKRSTVQNLKNIVATKTIEIEGIIKRRATNKDSPYLFPILDGSETPERAKAKIRQAIVTNNKWTNRIAKDLGINLSITFMVARHSFATVLKQGAAPAEFIQESLGHKSLATTESYLGSFENKTKKKFASLLTQFED